MSIKKLNVLHVIHGEFFGGIESVITNYQRYIDKDKIAFDYFLFSNNKHNLHRLADKHKSKVFISPTIGKNPIKFVFTLYRVIKKYKYQVIHIHTGIQIGIISLLAYLFGCKVRISHVHSTSLEVNNHKRFLFLWRLLIYIFCNKYIACTNEAAKFWYINNNVSIIPNSIPFDDYKYNNSLKKSNGLNFTNPIILGHAGRFVPVKNHKFLILIAKHLLQSGFTNFKILFAGDGPLFSDIKITSEDLIKSGHIELLGSVTDMPDFWSKIDIMLLPSFNEGFPLVFAEAQASGCYSIVSKTIESIKNCDLTNYVFADINNVEEWTKIIINYARPISRHKANIYSIHNTKTSANLLENIYLHTVDN